MLANTWGRMTGGDRDAFLTLYQSHYQALFCYGFSLSTDRELTKDCIQELFLEIWNNRLSLNKGTAIHADELPADRRRPAIFCLWQREKGKGNLQGDGDLRKDGDLRGGKNNAANGTPNKGRRSLVTVILLLLLAACPFLWTHREPNPGLLTVKINDSGKPVVFTLSDGTVVTLAPQGVLRYPGDFGAPDRKVILEGEAQFQVSRNGSRPFTVCEGDIVATVLGTIFHVKDRAVDPAILVELISGKLKVETVARQGHPSQSILLDPDERVVYRPGSQRLYKEKWQSRHEPLRAAGHLVFRKNNFDEVAPEGIYPLNLKQL